MTVSRSIPRRHDRRPTPATVLILFSVIAVIAAERDLHRRPATQIRGSNSIWRLANLNALGALAYLAWGRIQNIALSVWTRRRRVAHRRSRDNASRVASRKLPKL